MRWSRDERHWLRRLADRDLVRLVRELNAVDRAVRGFRGRDEA